LKKQSAVNLPKPPEAPTFFLDRTLGKNIFASSLRTAGLSVEIHDDHFPADARDQEWLRKVGDWNWVVVTNDRHIRYRPLELAALKASKVRTFVFTRGNLRAEEMAGIFLRALPKIQRILRKNRGPFIASVSRNGDVRLIL
jgi:predicted nuclease of predicted toxin-antitoxin system